MEVDDDATSEKALRNASQSIGTSHEEEVAEKLRDIIYRNRKRSQSSALRSPLPPKRSSLDSARICDPRLQNKYGLNVKSPFIIHMEKILLRPSPPSQARDSEAIETNNNIKSGIDNLDNNTSNVSQTSHNGTYGIIAFGKHINRHISNFLSAFDLKTLGKNKFSVTFPDGNTANKFCDIFNDKSNIMFPSETWIAYVPNYKVIRQFIIRGVDDDDSPEELIKNVRPPPEWNILWQPPFEAVRLKRPTRTRDSNNVSSTKYIDSDTYVVRFRTLSVPSSVIYMGKRCYLTPFIEKVRRCQKCQRFGHVARICRTPDKSAVCQRCVYLVIGV